MKEKRTACDRSEAEAYFEWLDDLRAAGTQNMFGARPLLAAEFGLDRALSAEVLSAWAKSYDGQSSAAQRAAKMFQ